MEEMDLVLHQRSEVRGFHDGKELVRAMLVKLFGLQREKDLAMFSYLEGREVLVLFHTRVVYNCLYSEIWKSEVDYCDSAGNELEFH